jgi:hypothetical protein
VSYGWVGTQSGFFTCGDTALSILPTEQYQLSVQCPNNGIAWSVALAVPRYFTPNYAYSFSQSAAAVHCPASLLGVCNTVGALPPYICEKKVYLPFFTILSTALANTQTLLALILLVFGVLLPKISEYVTGKKSEEEEKKATSAESDLELNAIPSPVHEAKK